MRSPGPEPQEEDSDTVSVGVDCRDGRLVCAHFSCLYKQLVASLPATPRPNEKTAPTAVTNEPPPPDILQEQLHRIARSGLRAWSPRLGIPETYLTQDWIRQNIFIWLKFTKRDKSHRWVCTLRSRTAGNLVSAKANCACRGSSDVFYRSDDAPPDLNRMTGKWRLSENQAADLVRKAVRELGFQGETAQVLLQPPELVQKPNLRPPPTVPRYLLMWQKTKPTGRGDFRFISCRIAAEVDADRRRVPSLSVYLWEEGDDQILVR